MKNKLNQMWNKKKETEEKVERAAIVTAFFIVGSLLLILATPVVAYNVMYSDTIYQGVSVDGISVSKLTKDQALAKIQSEINQIDQQGIVFQVGTKKVSLKPTSFAVNDPDLTYELISFDADKMVDQAFAYGRSKTMAANLVDQMKAIANGVQIPIALEIHENELKTALEQNFAEFEVEGQDAHFIFNEDQLEIVEEERGRKLMIDEVFEDVRNNLSFSDSPVIEIDVIEVNPRVTTNDINNRLDEVREFLDNAEALTLEFENQEWVLEKQEYRDALAFVPSENGSIELAFDEEKGAELLESVREDIYREPVDAELEFNEDKTDVIHFSPQRNGRELAVSESIKKINEVVFAPEEPEYVISLIVNQDEPDVALADLNDLGIKDLIAYGESDYSGSPANRRHNIEVGRKSFDGILLAPGEEFSALKYLGNVDAANGYLPELVIKGHETVPEYGGGLCQVSTTMFRAALNAGVEITQRRNHSYTVSYYNPIGTDATIYSPAPDFRFKNDFDNHILIHTINDTENSKLIYEIWGTDDGREVRMTDPVTYDWVAAPPTKIVETTDLPPGVKRCTESAHAGVKAHFDRFITYSDGTEYEERFNSQYRPWQAVCLVGVEELESEEEDVQDDGEELSEENVDDQVTEGDDEPIAVE